MNYKRIKYYFKAGLWNEEMVKMAIRKGIITKVQFQDIVGTEYN